MKDKNFDQLAAELAAEVDRLRATWPEVFMPHTKHVGDPFTNRYATLDGNGWIVGRDKYGLIWSRAYDRLSLAIYADSGDSPTLTTSFTYGSTVWAEIWDNDLDAEYDNL